MKINVSMLIALIFSAFPIKSDEQKEAWLVVSQEDGVVQIEIYSNLALGVSGKYSLEVKKVGPSGTSTNRQAGSVPTSKGAVLGPISVSRVSLEPGGNLHVSLSVEDEHGHLIEDSHILAR